MTNKSGSCFKTTETVAMDNGHALTLMLKCKIFVVTF
jgi:hypothetical protein